ncbi:MAG: hypothetical protein F4196_07425 [Acidimicrobiia bacterium]|nr:hypothetical protein [Acidimicrobiia bacterium]
MGNNLKRIDTKMSDDYLTPVLERFFADMERPVMLRKRDYHHLIRFLQPDEVHQDVVRVLDGIASQANQARPAGASGTTAVSAPRSGAFPEAGRIPQAMVWPASK